MWSLILKRGAPIRLRKKKRKKRGIAESKSPVTTSQTYFLRTLVRARQVKFTLKLNSGDYFIKFQSEDTMRETTSFPVSCNSHPLSLR